jgi:hypothetical protein
MFEGLTECLTLKASFHPGKLSVDWNGKKIFLCLVSSGLELMTLTQREIFLSVQSTDNFPEWKLALTLESVPPNISYKFFKT